MTLAPGPRLDYCASVFERRRRSTRVVMVGDVGVGGDNPIRVQSMTTTRTLDTEATVAQALRLVEAGCEIVRITAPTVADARNLGEIRRQLDARGVRVPLVADIHFSPAAAFEAALHVEKVRINPGNFADSKSFAVREYSDAEYQAELDRIDERFRPVVLRCKERGVAMRIGTNHGSLSDRIMNRFGDTPEGMVESALEFLAICEAYDYRDVIFSMKASNPKVMIQAYRLLAARLDALGKPYPFHLGVTEAGDGEDGRIKSAVGIGTLLEDGLGDTIRVSLTEDPEAEIPVAFAIARRYSAAPSGSAPPRPTTAPWNPYRFERRAAEPIDLGPVRVGVGTPPAVVASIAGPLAQAANRLTVARRLLIPLSRRQPRADLLGVTVVSPEDAAALADLYRGLTLSANDVQILARVDASGDGLSKLIADVAPYVSLIGLPAEQIDAAMPAVAAAQRAVLVEAEVSDDPWPAVEVLVAAAERLAAATVPAILSLHGHRTDQILHGYRALVARLADRNGTTATAPLLLRSPTSDCSADSLAGLLDSAIGVGGLLCDGFGDAIEVAGPGDPLVAMRLAFNVLQAAGARISKTDYVACPSCGRTLFDLQTTTARIRSRTDHLTGLKIAIMGCVVNGPGEMADADFGYVGGAPGQVNLYVGKECVERGVPEGQADDRLIELIKSRQRWVDPE